MAIQKIGGYVFIIGVVIAIIAGIASGLLIEQMSGVMAYVPIVMLIFGLAIGLLNIRDKHMSDFLIAAIAVSVVGMSFGGLLAIDNVIKPVGTILSQVVLYIVLLVGPAALVVGLKQIYMLAKEQVN